MRDGDARNPGHGRLLGVRVAVRVHRHAAQFGMALVVLVLAAACGGDEDDGGARADIVEFAGTTSEYQRAILEDGVVEFEEYEAAVLETIRCIEDAGFEITGGPELRGGQFHYSWGSPGSSDPDGSRGREVGTRCAGEYSSDVQKAWLTQNMPSEEEQQRIHSEAARLFRECLADAGWPVDQETRAEELTSMLGAMAEEDLRHLASHQTCQADIEREFDLPYFAG
jgi:hypothetical protein